VRVGESLVQTAGRLSDEHIADARLEAEVLVRHVLGIERPEFFAALNERLTTHQRRRLCSLVRRRLDAEPLSYILGAREFYGLKLVVNPRVLIPRQETELLVDKALEHCSTRRAEEGLHIADVGTGSGAVAIAIAVNLPQATVHATDARRDALAVADVNRRRHGVSHRVHLYEGDLLEPLHRPVDVIVSNPPYIKTGEIDNLAPEVRREPLWALDGGTDGLELTGRLMRLAPEYIRPGGRIMVEIAPEQLAQVSQLARQAFPRGRVSFARDLLGLPRVVVVDLN